MTEVTQQTFCTNCGGEMNQGGEVCLKCGIRQGTTINHCYECGNEVKPQQELCLNCGVNPRKVSSHKRKNSSVRSTDINPMMAGVLGFLIPGLPSILWLNQKTKGIVLLVVTLISYGVLLGWIIGIVGAIDGYQLAQKANQGQRLEEWQFFWSK